MRHHCVVRVHSWIFDSDNGSGKLGLCYCPGKTVTRAGVYWKRSLAADLARLRDHFKVTGERTDAAGALVGGVPPASC